MDEENPSLKLLEHHARHLGQFVADNPDEDVGSLAFRFVKGLESEGYPQNPEFVNTVTGVLQHIRDGKEVEMLPHDQDSLREDPMCKICRKCYK